MSMFCYQCQETAFGTGCTKRGVCGKTEDVAKLQDVLIYSLKGIAEVVVADNIPVKDIPDVNHELVKSLFMTITNANFDGDSIFAQIEKLLALRDALKSKYGANVDKDSATFTVLTLAEALEKAESVGVLATENEDIRSLRQFITYGLKGMAAYTEHALNIGKENLEIYDFMYHTLAQIEDDSLGKDELIQLVLKTGETGVKSMALIDEANTSKYGHPEMTEVNIGVRSNPAILISGHDLVDLEQLLEQTQGTGVDVYTHSEMLPAHSYPFFKKYDNFVGNYGNAWHRQVTEFETFKGPILFTTNCIVPPRKEEIRERIFTTGATGYPGCPHIEADAEGKKDFSQIIEMAKKLPAPEEIETGTILGGFAHNQVFALSDQVVDAVKSGAIRKFFVMSGCDGRMKDREYYTEFAKALPKDTVILTSGCAKYRYNKLGLGDINGIPRVLDAGQCNDSYSWAVVALKLKEIFAAEDINDLPIQFNIAWYEQKAVIVLMALLSMGFKNIHIGPTLPGFLSDNVRQVVIDTFGLAKSDTVENDLAAFLG
ncbi:hydroxylamine reductase [Lachnospiraceae bacterium PF1-21]|uniref:Hydroxylamine reductase n=1 Tax=Ohessyouella blattaphilus TaxID=2949333 RepID=A0ABT1EFG2_9FIRM|nr:hydroxylamine reductase [Ohessyouella blattaphilus]MCP1109439.1 hydroxylamine reductase [Ohessyouella blattaphilus]MCR8562833.1 hydroxylamine reductase [Ohessyouella blattaphilus]MDL2249256.1 hydroxylamine reductase [Lachnospiraceae bacterium OttesenSCG-928-J05]